jgi:uncharacterized HAD superfamily protein
MNIMCDLDGVIYPWTRAVYTEQVIYHNETRDYETFWQSFEKEHNDLYFENLIQIKHLYGTQVPSVENLLFLDLLTAREHNIFYVTQRPLSVELDTRQWLRRYDIPQREKLFFVKDKVVACNSLGIDLIFEDRIKNVIPLFEAGFNIVAVKAVVTPKELYPCPCVDNLYEAERYF